MNVNEILFAQNLITLKSLGCVRDLCHSDNEMLHLMSEGFIRTFPNIDASKVYVDTSGSIHLAGSYIYWDDERAVIFRLPCFYGTDETGEYSVSIMGYTNEQIDNLIVRLNDYRASEKWDELFSFCPENFRMEYVARYQNQITKEKIYSMFIDAYTNIDYGFGHIDSSAFNHICKSKTETDNIRTKSKLKVLPDTVTIYRGEGDGSTNIESAFSWTTDLNVAVFFATKNSNRTAKVYSAKVNKQDIVEYIDDRDEKEVLVHPDSVFDIKAEIEMLPVDETKKTSQILNWYQGYRRKLNILADELNINKTGAHGATHMLRVLLYALLISTDYPQLFRNEKTIELLCTACITHDIGRTNDWEDCGHGAASFDVVKKCTNFEASDKLNFLLTYHCRDDAEAEQTEYKNKSITWLLYQILKDADALDRVRFGIRDLDINMLRLPISRTLVLFAEKALTGIHF